MQINYRSTDKVTRKALEDFYQFEVVMDITVNRDNIQPVILQFDATILFVGTYLEERHNDGIKIIIDKISCLP